VLLFRRADQAVDTSLLQHAILREESGPAGAAFE